MGFDFGGFEESYYEASVVRPAARRRLAEDVQADVCVVGGGISGISCALNLAEQGRRVVLLEAAAVGWGASGRSGGQIIHGYSTGALARHAKQGGVSEKALFEFSCMAIDNVKTRIARHNIQCDWHDGYATAAAKPRHLKELAAEAEKMRTVYDYDSVRIFNTHRFREIVSSRAYYGGLVDSFGGHLHPLKYTLGLAQAADAAGAQIFEHTVATEIKQTAAGCEVITAGGTVRCGQVVIAGNAYNHHNLGDITARIMPVGTYIAATPPLGGAAANLITDGRCICDSNFVLDYYRLSADSRLLFGGRVSYSTVPPRDLKQSLHKRMTRVFPQLSDIAFEYAWGGYVAITQSRFPDIGRAGANVYYTQGYSGHGMALSGFAGKIIAQAILGDTGTVDVFHKIKHPAFPGGKALRTPLLLLATTYYRLRDLL